jgi:hypothetical protein
LPKSCEYCAGTPFKKFARLLKGRSHSRCLSKKLLD